MQILKAIENIQGIFTTKRISQKDLQTVLIFALQRIRQWYISLDKRQLNSGGYDYLSIEMKRLCDYESSEKKIPSILFPFVLTEAFQVAAKIYLSHIIPSEIKLTLEAKREVLPSWARKYR